MFLYRLRDFTAITMSHHNTTTSESPFEQVRAAEDREHARLEQEKKKWEQATMEALREIDESKTAKADALRTSLSDELKNATATEADGMIRTAREEAKKDITHLDAHAAKHRAKVEDDLLKKALDPQFLSV